MGGLERFGKGEGGPEVVGERAQWAGRNQGCKGGDVDDGSSTVDRGASNGVAATRGGRTNIANKEGSAGREWRGREDDGTGADADIRAWKGVDGVDTVDFVGGRSKRVVGSIDDVDRRSR
eukprot:scaffold9909_cov102-Amphora_coffeaeformis.AAC.2